jgi:hypothetical protein
MWILSEEKRREILCPYKHTCTDCPDEQIIRCENLVKAATLHIYTELMEYAKEAWLSIEYDPVNTKWKQAKYLCIPFEIWESFRKEVEGK